MSKSSSSAASLVERPTPTVFQLFPSLPIELRLKIWRQTISQPRIVPIRCGASLSSPQDRVPSPSSSGCSSPARIPTSLQVCCESRTETLLRCRLMFGIGGRPGKVFFNPDIDVLYFGARDGYMASEAQFRTLMCMGEPEELAAVRRVAINESLFWPQEASDVASAATLTIEVLQLLRSRMPAVRELIFVPRDENPIYQDEVDFVDPSVTKSILLLMLRIQDSMTEVCNQFPEWRPPKWEVKMLAASPLPQGLG